MAQYLLSTSEAFCDRLHEAGLLDNPDTVQRVIIDIQIGHVPQIYVKRVADNRVLDVLVSAGINLVDNTQVTA